MTTEEFDNKLLETDGVGICTLRMLKGIAEAGDDTQPADGRVVEELFVWVDELTEIQSTEGITEDDLNLIFKTQKLFQYDLDYEIPEANLYAHIISRPEDLVQYRKRNRSAWKTIGIIVSKIANAKELYGVDRRKIDRLQMAELVKSGLVAAYYTVWDREFVEYVQELIDDLPLNMLDLPRLKEFLEEMDLPNGLDLAMELDDYWAENRDRLNIDIRYYNGDPEIYKKVYDERFRLLVRDFILLSRYRAERDLV